MLSTKYHVETHVSQNFHRVRAPTANQAQAAKADGGKLKDHAKGTKYKVDQRDTYNC